MNPFLKFQSAKRLRLPKVTHDYIIIQGHNQLAERTAKLGCYGFQAAMGSKTVVARLYVDRVIGSATGGYPGAGR